jgi:hypothetical protein
MYRVIKLNKYKFSDIQFYRKCYQFYRKKFAMHCKFYQGTQEICNALQISRKSFVYLQRISFLAILKSASNLNGNLNCSKELEHYAS